MNKCIFTGNLTKDIDLRFAAGSGKAVARFGIAVKGFKKDDVSFLNCIAFGKTAETMAQYLNKGSKVILDCSVKTGKYEKDGNTIYTTDFIVNSFEFGSTGNKDNSNQENDLMPIEDGGDIPF